jgi:hypothetical protein
VKPVCPPPNQLPPVQPNKQTTPQKTTTPENVGKRKESGKKKKNHLGYYRVFICSMLQPLGCPSIYY